VKEKGFGEKREIMFMRKGEREVPINLNFMCQENLNLLAHRLCAKKLEFYMPRNLELQRFS
jgi:hypothetical protein